LIPTWKKGREVVKGRVLLLGDAAGFADPLTGEGIYYAVRSAQLAASVIEDFLQGHTVGLGKYQGLVETELIPDLAVAGKVAKVLSRFPQQAFTLLHQSKEVWKLICGLMYGELSYVIIEEALGGWENIVGKLSGKQ
jgi:flavin-dependent dehydrogenase